MIVNEYLLIFMYNEFMQESTPIEVHTNLAHESTMGQYRGTWELLKLKIKPLIMIQLLQVGAMIVVGLIFSIIALAVLIPFGITGVLSMSQNMGLALLEILPKIAPILLIIISLVFLALLSLSLVFQGANLKILDENLSIRNALKSSYKFVPQLLISSFVAGFLVLGGLFLFFVPGLIIAFFLIFIPYEIILADKKVIPAIKSSVTMVKRNFKEVLFKVIALVLPIVVIIEIFDGILNEPNSSEVSPIFNLITYIIGVFGMVYIYRLYKQIKAKSGESKQISLKWLVLTSTIGWGMFILMISAFIQLSKVLLNSSIENFNNQVPIEQTKLR